MIEALGRRGEYMEARQIEGSLVPARLCAISGLETEAAARGSPHTMSVLTEFTVKRRKQAPNRTSQ